MKTSSPFYPLSLLCAAVLVGGCASSVKLDDTAGAPVVSRNVGATAGTPATGGAASGAAPQSQVASVDLSRDSAAAANATAQRVVYFDYDSFAIRDDFKPLIENHAKVLAGNKGKKLVVEGHTDERGGREYNLALGQKRAEAVVRSLALLGAGDAQLEAVSFGKERPAAQGADESAFEKNRRAELKDR